MMEFEFWRPWFRVVLVELEIWEYVLLLLYALVTLAVLIRSRREFVPLTWRRGLLFLGLLAASLLVNHFLLLDWSVPDLPPPPDLPMAPSRLIVPLLGLLPVLVAGATLGVAPAMVVGLVSGLARIDTAVGSVAEPFHFAFFGFLVAVLLRQDYRGKLPWAARQPLIAALAVAPLLTGLLVPSVFLHVAGSGLVGLDYAMALASARFLPALLESAVAGAILQAVYLLLPGLRPVHVARRSPPYSRTMRRRQLFLFLPMIAVTTCVLVYAVTATTLRMVTEESVHEMTRSAEGVVEDIPYFIHTGQGLLNEFADDEQVWQDDPVALEDYLSGAMRTLVFFDQLMLFDADGQLLALYPPPPSGDPALTKEEATLLSRVLMDGAPQVSSAHRSARGEPHLAFLAPVERAGSTAPRRALVGRTRLDVNPMINRMLADLQWVYGEGEGFIVDEEGHIVSHSDSGLLLAEWRVDEGSPLVVETPRGRVYESRDAQRNARQLVYYLPADGYPWAVVVQLPYEVVMGRAQTVATPLLLLQLLFGGGMIVVTPLVTGLLVRPLKQLAAAADRIADGDLAQPVQVSHEEDEVGRVGDAFEGMRVRLKARMEDLSLLLAIGQEVSATLELSKGMPFILEGALRATGAQVARVVFLSAEGEPLMAMARGEPVEGVEALDRPLIAAVREQKRHLIIENLARAKTMAGFDSLDGAVRAVVALPVYARGRMSALMWLGYGEARRFDNLEMGMLSTLASQTAVLAENARLFQAAEGGRRRLAAILNSTTDAVLVTDQRERILLLNPAAELAFGLSAEALVGRQIEQAGLVPALVQLFKSPVSPDRASTDEIPLPDGRTLYASLSAILDADGEQIGRVAVMRDITHFKELDELKSEFLSTVSHDLRAPLMFMRGYANMLPAVGEFNDTQRDYLEKILCGVGQIDDLVSDLLDLGRIEAGVGVVCEPCHLEVIMVEAVDGMRARAAAKEIALRLEPVERTAVVAGDAALLRRAITNLLDNAVKFTPAGGSVTAGLSVRTDEEGEWAIVRIADTGIGIIPEDQARVFEKFYRVRRRDAPDTSGTGLGLAIVKSVAERHGGKVWLESELYEGSTFYIALPLGENGSRGSSMTSRREMKG